MPKALVLPSGDRHSAAPCARSADLGGSLSLTRNGRGNHRATSNAAPENSGGAQSRSVRLTWSGTWSNAGAVTRRATLAGGLADVRSVLANIRRQMSAQLRWQSEDVTVTETSSSTQLAFIVTSSGALSSIASSARLGCPVEPSWYRHSPTEPKQQFRLTETAACEPRSCRRERHYRLP